MLTRWYSVSTAAAVVGAAVVLASCGVKATPPVRSEPAVSTVTSTVPQPAATVPPVTADVAPASPTTVTTTPEVQTTAFPAVVNAAMQTFAPEPGLEAPASLPPTENAVSAQTTDLGGSDSVTLIATPIALPVNDPSLSYSPSTNLGTFTSSPTADVAAANRFMTTDATNTLASCAGAAIPTRVLGLSATECSTLQGSAVNWTVGNWRIQVLSAGTTAAPTAEATEVQQWIAANDLPVASAGIFSAVAPASSALAWTNGKGVYQTRSTQSVAAAAQLATAMRPWTRS